METKRFWKFLLLILIGNAVFTQHISAQWNVVQNGAQAVVYGMTTYGSNLVFAGDNGTTNGYVYQWNGASTSTLSTQLNQSTTSTPYIFALTTYSGNLYAVGDFNKANAGGTLVNNIAEWNGSSWVGLTSGGGTGLTAGGTDNVTNAMVVYNGNLIVGGDFLKAGGTSVKHIAQWNGTTWSALGNGLGSNATDGVSALAVWNGNLYAAGIFQKDGSGTTTLNNIAEWNGSSWVALTGSGGTGVTGNNGGYDAVNPIVYALTNVDGAGGGLFVGGDFKKAGNTTVSNIAEWDGTNWNALGSGMTVNNGDAADVYALYANNWNVYAVGDFKKAGGTTVNFVADWNSSWNAMATGFNSDAHSLWVWNGVLFAGGIFDLSGTNYIAQWGAALPITLLDFNAQYEVEDNSVHIDWSTASETNNKMFTVERTMDGVKWETLTNVAGAGNSRQTLNYSTKDESPYSGVSYYRLKQTDYDGNYTYSDIQSVTITAATNTLSIVPNPAGSFVSVIFNASMAGNSVISMYDYMGRITASTPVNTVKGANIKMMDVAGYANGTYIVTVNNGVTQYTSRVIISH